MNTQLVDHAIELFIKTIPMETMNVDGQSSEYYRLYDLECELFSCLMKMSEDDKQEYRRRVWQAYEQNK